MNVCEWYGARTLLVHVFIFRDVNLETMGEHLLVTEIPERTKEIIEGTLDLLH